MTSIRAKLVSVADPYFNNASKTIDENYSKSVEKINAGFKESLPQLKTVLLKDVKAYVDDKSELKKKKSNLSTNEIELSSTSKMEQKLKTSIDFSNMPGDVNLKTGEANPEPNSVYASRQSNKKEICMKMDKIISEIQNVEDLKKANDALQNLIDSMPSKYGYEKDANWIKRAATYDSVYKMLETMHKSVSTKLKEISKETKNIQTKKDKEIGSIRKELDKKSDNKLYAFISDFLNSEPGYLLKQLLEAKIRLEDSNDRYNVWSSREEGFTDLNRMNREVMLEDLSSDKQKFQKTINDNITTLINTYGFNEKALQSLKGYKSVYNHRRREYMLESDRFLDITKVQENIQVPDRDKVEKLCSWLSDNHPASKEKLDNLDKEFSKELANTYSVYAPSSEKNEEKHVTPTQSSSSSSSFRK